MISQALAFLCSELRPHLGLEPHAVRPSGRPAVATGPRHAVATLIAVRESPALRQAQALPPARSAPAAAPMPPLELDLLLSFGGSDYAESLDLLAKTIEFFHAHPDWSASTAPDAGANQLPASIERIALHALTLSLEDQHHLWSALGAQQMPSVLYRVTVVAVGQAENDTGPRIGGR